jgi:hypothetical protein
LISNEIIINSLKINNNKISGLTNPIFDDEIANKGYIDDLANVPTGPINSILIRKGDDFVGTDELLFRDNLEITNEFEINNGLNKISIKPNSINNIQDPTSSD